ncbi:acyl-[acyl-carrier-protein] thioesterase [Gottschalkiaceae bacterium SANA]|nr:acyl-[acyl-carrier-protein] thioesterase [Gottschalkiaceae bacterium SANA]
MTARKANRGYLVHSYEVDAWNRVLPQAVLLYMQDLATLQSEECGVGIARLRDNRLGWMLYQMDYTLTKDFFAYDTIDLSTVSTAFDTLYAYRKFWFRNSEGQIIGEAKSKWVLFDFEKRKIAKKPDWLREAYGLTGDEKDKLSFSKIPTRFEPMHAHEIKVGYADIDINRHTNNARYLIWAIEGMSLEWIRKHRVRHVNVIFKCETRLGENIRIETKQEEKESIHRVKKEDGKLAAVLEIEWESVEKE